MKRRRSDGGARRVTPAVAAFVAALLSFAAGSAARADLHAGDVAPAFRVAEVRGAGGSQAHSRGADIALSSLRGKPIYLNFFASWCVPCNEEAPSVALLAKQFVPRGLVLVGIDEQEDRKAALGFARKYGWVFPIGIDDGDMAKSYQAEVLPVHVFIAKSGKISTIRFGIMSSNEIAAAIARIL